MADNKLSIIDGSVWVRAGGDVAENTNHDFQIYGSTSDKSKAAFYVANSAGTPILFLRNDGKIGIKTKNPRSLLEINGSVDITSIDGIDYTPGSDVNTDLITVNVTGTPKLWWDEANDSFKMNKGFVIDGTLIFSGNLLPDTDSLRTIGNTTKAWKELHLNNGATDGGTIFFNAHTGAQKIKSTATGSILDFVGFQEIEFGAHVQPSVASSYDLGKSLSRPWRFIYLDSGAGNGGRIFFDAATSTDTYIGASADGATLDIAKFEKVIIDLDDGVGDQTFTIDNNGGDLELISSTNMRLKTAATTPFIFVVGSSTKFTIADTVISFFDEVLVNAAEKLTFRDPQIFINSNIDSEMTIQADGKININSNTHVGDGFGFIVGHTVKIDFGAIPEFQVLGTATPDSSMGFARFENNASGPDVRFLKSRGATIGSNVIVQDGDTLGRFRFQGADTIDFNTTAAEILGKVDGTPGGNDIPGSIVFRTRTAGAGLSDKVVIDNAGDVSISKNIIVNGFSTLGSGAPTIKMKKLTGTTAATEGGSATVAHGVTFSKIISQTCVVTVSNDKYSPGYTTPAGKQYSLNSDATNMSLINHATNSEGILSKPFIVVILYEE